MKFVTYDVQVCFGTVHIEIVQWTHLQLISFAIAPVVLLIVHLLKRRSGGAIANESTVRRGSVRTNSIVVVVAVV